jgi:hypothetical protein
VERGCKRDNPKALNMLLLHPEGLYNNILVFICVKLMSNSWIMWSKIFIIISIVFTTGIATNVFINLDNSFKSFPIFHRDHGYALIDHVIKTLSLLIADCFLVCQETLSCFSFNYREFINGTYVCELNRSNKKQSPESFVRKEGYEYAETTVCC